MPKDSSISIYSQSLNKNMGELIIPQTGLEDRQCGIGGNGIMDVVTYSGNITINGGKITSYSGLYSAAIGGAADAVGGDVIINNGIINATGNKSAAIGGGWNGYCGNITISGGTINAFADTSYIAAIGLTLQHDTKTDEANNGIIRINGGNINTSPGKYGIGAGGFPKDISVIVSGGTINGKISEGSTVDIRTDFDIDYDFKVVSGTTFTVAEGKTLTIANSHILTVDGGILSNNGTINGLVKKYVYYLDSNQTMNTCYEYTNVTSGDTTWKSTNGTGWYIAENDITINQRVKVDGDIHLILTDNSKLTINGGIDVSNNNSITIYAQSNGNSMGELIADAINTDGAGIGSQKGNSSGSITINGGNINAYGGKKSEIFLNKEVWIGAAGIGGGGGGYNAQVGNITINAGKIQAIAHPDNHDWGSGAGIGGGGNSQSSGNITINGGEIIATAGENGAAGIGGGGHNGGIGIISINDCIVYATGTGENPHAIGGGKNNSDSTNITYNNCIISDEANNEIVVYGNYTLENDFTVNSGKKFTVLSSGRIILPTGKSLVISEGASLDNQGTIHIQNGATLLINGSANGNGTLICDEGSTFNKGTIPKPNTPTLSTKTKTSVTLNTIQGNVWYGYKTSENSDVIYWQESPTFTYLTANTTYYFYAKMQENDYMNSLISDSLTVTTNPKTDYSVDMFNFILPNDLVYDGKSKYVNIQTKNGITNVGTITINYYDNNGSQINNPISAGTYTVKINVAESTEYNAVNGLTNDLWKFTIYNASQSVPIGITKENETISRKQDGKILGVNNTMEYRKENETNYTPIDNTTLTNLASGKYYIRYAAKENYNASSDVEIVINSGNKLKVTLPTTSYGYIISSDKDKADWHEKIEIKVSINDGYSKTNDYVVKGNDITLLADEDGKYIITDLETDIIISVDGIADITKPKMKISINDNTWKALLNNITFGLFFKNTQSVSIEAIDVGSGINSIEYYLSTSEMTLEKLNTISDWEDYTEAFDINPDNEYIVYAKSTDNAGNITYICSNGIVLDKTAPIFIGVENNKAYKPTQIVTVADKFNVTVTANDDPIVLDDNQFDLSGLYGIVILKGIDQAGNETSLTITVNEKGLNIDTEMNSDGSSTTTKTDNDGKVIEVLITNSDGSTVKTENKEDGSTVVTKADKNGQVTEKLVTNKDGSSIKTENKSDGTTVVTKSNNDGKVIEITETFKDGSSIKTENQTNGDVVVIKKDNKDQVVEKITKHPNGSYIKDGFKPTMIEGDQSIYKEDNSLTFRSNDEIVNFLKVTINDTDLDAQYYDVVSGSIKVTLKDNYLKTLTAGSYTLGIVSTNGVATGSFTIPVKEVIEPADPITPSIPEKVNDSMKPDTPITGDNMNIIAMIGLLGLSFIAIYVLLRTKKEK